MVNILETDDFKAPYTGLTFPGQAEEEKLLYITRESPIMLAVRMAGFSLVVSILILVGALLMISIGRMLGFSVSLVIVLLLLIGFVLLFGGMWWVYQVYRRTVFIITTRRLTKFIHTTPWNRYQMSLGLDKVEDSGAYTKGYLQALFGLGTFVARSSAGNIKNFKIVNIHYAEDLHNWMNKLMFTFNKEQDKLDSFRPFAAKKAGERY
jgi:hypothetical protein